MLFESNVREKSGMAKLGTSESWCQCPGVSIDVQGQGLHFFGF